MTELTRKTGLQSRQKRVTFRVVVKKPPKNKESVKIYIVGNHAKLGWWNPGLVRLDKRGDGSWSKTIYFKEGTELEYKITRGSWFTEALDSKAKRMDNLSLKVKSDTTLEVVVEDWRDNVYHDKHGIVGTVKYHRDMKGEGVLPRDLIVWLPPSYTTEKRRRYPVLYMHDGQNLFDPDTAFLGVDWEMDQAATRLIKKGEIEEIIIVGIYNTLLRNAEYCGSKRGMAYMNFLVRDLKPFIDRIYRTRPGREDTAIMGSSLGGLVSFLQVWHHSDVFSKAGCISPSFLYRRYNSIHKVERYDGPDKDLRIYMDCGGTGGEENLYPGCLRMIAALGRLGYREQDNLEWFYDPRADHTEAAWASRAERPLRFLFGVK